MTQKRSLKFSLYIPAWNVEALTGYKPITTFWQDFSIAERFGEKAIRDTYNRAFAEWKHDYKYLTELVMVLNHKIGYHYNPNATDRENALAYLYNDLWSDADLYANTHLEGDEYAYFYSITD